MTNVLLYVFAAIFGLILGSFINVVALRDRKRKSIVTGRSECPHCHHVLSGLDLLPLLSFLFLSARCRYCKAPISWRYPLVELCTAGLTVFCAWYGLVQFSSVWLTVGVLCASLLLLVISLIDLETMEVPVEYCLIAALLGGLGVWLSGRDSLVTVLLGILVGAGSILLVQGIWWVCTRTEGMGSGDIFIAGAVGAVTGYPLILVALMSAVVSGAVVGSFMILVSKKKMESRIPFGPFLFIGLLVALGVGNRILAWYLGYV